MTTKFWVLARAGVIGGRTRQRVQSVRASAVNAVDAVMAFAKAQPETLVLSDPGQARRVERPVRIGPGRNTPQVDARCAFPRSDYRRRPMIEIAIGRWLCSMPVTTARY